mmetsp:Transcript_41586/g.72128  ORF Transcript_41586/g.72128 Transcript_41586/m.72128 type:complete len:813 (+) Transcript_41586:155-2593(+)
MALLGTGMRGRSVEHKHAVHFVNTVVRCGDFSLARSKQCPSLFFHTRACLTCSSGTSFLLLKTLLGADKECRRQSIRVLRHNLRLKTGIGCQAIGELLLLSVDLLAHSVVLCLGHCGRLFGFGQLREDIALPLIYLGGGQEQEALFVDVHCLCVQHLLFLGAGRGRSPGGRFLLGGGQEQSHGTCLSLREICLLGIFGGLFVQLRRHVQDARAGLEGPDAAALGDFQQLALLLGVFGSGHELLLGLLHRLSFFVHSGVQAKLHCVHVELRSGSVRLRESLGTVFSLGDGGLECRHASECLLVGDVVLVFCVDCALSSSSDRHGKTFLLVQHKVTQHLPGLFGAIVQIRGGTKLSVRETLQALPDANLLLREASGLEQAHLLGVEVGVGLHQGLALSLEFAQALVLQRGPLRRGAQLLLLAGGGLLHTARLRSSLRPGNGRSVNCIVVNRRTLGISRESAGADHVAIISRRLLYLRGHRIRTNLTLLNKLGGLFPGIQQCLAGGVVGRLCVHRLTALGVQLNLLLVQAKRVQHADGVIAVILGDDATVGLLVGQVCRNGPLRSLVGRVLSGGEQSVLLVVAVLLQFIHSVHLGVGVVVHLCCADGFHRGDTLSTRRSGRLLLFLLRRNCVVHFSALLELLLFAEVGLLVGVHQGVDQLDVHVVVRDVFDFIAENSFTRRQQGPRFGEDIGSEHRTAASNFVGVGAVQVDLIGILQSHQLTLDLVFSHLHKHIGRIEGDTVSRGKGFLLRDQPLLGSFPVRRLGKARLGAALVSSGYCGLVLLRLVGVVPFALLVACSSCIVSEVLLFQALRLR